jgi:hypothetical protein
VGARPKADAIKDIERWFSQVRNGAYEVTSDFNAEYNCAAFAAGEVDIWWEPLLPDGFWPVSVPAEFTVAAYAGAYRTLGFEVCESAEPEANFEKIAIYGRFGDFTHAARQLPSGRWTSKLGRAEDIEHDTLAQLEGAGRYEYGFVELLMKRARR